ncbi:MAG: SRPBCC family protein [Gemmatimonadetes bacterium]|nr:SRPBCC family protein [Gemmatimonadota bacterium]
MFKKILIGIALLIAVVMALATTKPDTYTVTRSIQIAAAPEKVFAHVNDFHQWDAWSPWAKLDPAMKVTHSGAPSGVGAVYEWTGNSSVGAGRMEITRATPGSEVAIKLDFLEPIASSSVTTFTFAATNGGTNATWTMVGDAVFMTKVMMVFTSMDGMIGGDFEKGLAQLKTEAEKP